MDNTAKVRFERTNAQSQVKFYSNDVEDATLQFTFLATGAGWSFFLTDEGMFTFSPSADDETQNKYFTGKNIYMTGKLA